MIDSISINGNEVTIKLTDVSEEDKQKLMEIVEKYSDKKNKRWEPKDGEWYFCISGRGDIGCYCWLDDEEDKRYFNLRNCFNTQEEAEFELERWKVIVELQNYADEHNDEIDWNDLNSIKWTFYYDYSTKKIGVIQYKYTHYVNSINFSSKDNLRAAIDTVGEDRIKKYIFGVSEDEVN